jgi:hypothetical protein
VSVRLAGSEKYSAPRYQFPDDYDPIHSVNAVGFDISSFEIPEGELITGIRIRNMFNRHAKEGGDRVADPSGEGRVLTPSDEGWGIGNQPLSKLGGEEFGDDELDADILYVVGLHNIEPLPEGVLVSLPTAPGAKPRDDPTATSAAPPSFATAPDPDTSANKFRSFKIGGPMTSTNRSSLPKFLLPKSPNIPYRVR